VAGQCAAAFVRLISLGAFQGRKGARARNGTHRQRNAFQLLPRTHEAKGCRAVLEHPANANDRYLNDTRAEMGTKRVISDVLPFGRLLYGEPNAISNAVSYAKSTADHTVALVEAGG
jgi:hypothetical protein